MPIEKPPTKEELMKFLMQEEPLLSTTMVPLVQDQLDKWKLPFVITKNEDGEYDLHKTSVTELMLEKFITVNKQMLELKDDVRKLAAIEDEVLIAGPTGTGKELIARALHGDREGRFIAINCAGLPEQLVESILFGHVKGAFTGANTNKMGSMEAANKGTFFLDELGELPLTMQGKLLRAIQSKEVTPVGSNVDVKISCRIVCATNKNLKEMCNKSDFRLDLFARLSTFELDTTPLKERMEDVIPILKSIDGGEEMLSKVSVIDSIGLELNVRSLQKYVKRYKVLGRLPI